MTRGEIWKDFFKKTALTVLIAGVQMNAAISTPGLCRNMQAA